MSTCEILRLSLNTWRLIHEFHRHPVAIVSEDLSATLHVEIDTSSKLARRITVLDPQGNVFKEALVKPEEETPTWKLSASEIELWWSVGLGKQPLYTVKAELLDSQGDKVLHTASKRFGFRRLRLVQEPLKDQPGTSFVFECNNIRLFAGGSNWYAGACAVLLPDLLLMFYLQDSYRLLHHRC